MDNLKIRINQNQKESHTTQNMVQNTNQNRPSHHQPHHRMCRKNQKLKIGRNNNKNHKQTKTNPRKPHKTVNETIRVFSCQKNKPNRPKLGQQIRIPMDKRTRFHTVFNNNIRKYAGIV
jgi:hypothetical protein